MDKEQRQTIFEGMYPGISARVLSRWRFWDKNIVRMMNSLNFAVTTAIKTTSKQLIMRTFGDHKEALHSRWWLRWMTASLLVRIQEETAARKMRYHVSPS